MVPHIKRLDPATIPACAEFFPALVRTNASRETGPVQPEAILRALVHILLERRYGGCAANTDGEQECCDFFIHEISPGLTHHDGDLMRKARRPSLHSRLPNTGLTKVELIAARHNQP